MKLTDELKARIDGMDYETLLRKWRTAPVGDPMFQDESAEYFEKRMNELRAADPIEAVRASKSVGWGR